MRRDTQFPNLRISTTETTTADDETTAIPTTATVVAFRDCGGAMLADATSVVGLYEIATSVAIADATVTTAE